MSDSKYVVWCPSKGAPTTWHESLWEARNEARRLCTMPDNHGHQFFVLRACESVQYRTDPYVTKNYSRKDIPEAS